MVGRKEDIFQLSKYALKRNKGDRRDKSGHQDIGDTARAENRAASKECYPKPGHQETGKDNKWDAKSRQRLQGKKRRSK
ncbi:hypothetical protein BDW68DRAFT_141247 [Aspergillus falconensis]